MTTAATTVTSKDSTTDALLRFALRLDATLTGLCGLVHVAFADAMASLTGLTATQAFVLGAGFALYGVVVFRLAGVRRVRSAGRAVIAANLACTAVAIAVVLAGVLPLTGAGVAVLLAMGAYTAFFALLQYPGLRRLA